MKLSIFEKIAIKEIIYHNDAKTQKSDNFSDCGIKKLNFAFGWEGNQISSLINSLKRKSIIDSYDGELDVFYLTEEAIDFYFENEEEF